MRIVRDVRERLYSHVVPDPASDCLLWTGTTVAGYGTIAYKGRTHRVHRVAWELEYGPIPDGLVLDHVRARGCRHRNCVNLAHLEPVTRGENTLRNENHRAWRTHCPSGHPYDEVNTYINAKRGDRQCRTCFRLRKRTARAQAAEQAA